MFTTSIYSRNLQSKARIRVNQGSQGSSKTYSILQVIITMCLYGKEKIRCSIVSETLPHLRKGAMYDFFNILILNGLYDPKKHNRSELTYYFPNDSFVEFFSADDPLKVHGFRRDILFMNEAPNIPFDTYMQLEPRTAKVVFLDFNPTRTSWIHTEVIGNENVEYIHSTYLDNPFLPEGEKQSIISKKDRYPDWYRVYGLGETGELEGVVFNNWEQVDDDKFPDVQGVHGMDFGFVNDPTTLIELVKSDGELWVREKLWMYAARTSDIDRNLRMNKVPQDQRIWGDRSEPRLMKELRELGWPIYGCDNIGIVFSLNQLLEFKINITKGSTNLIKEFRNYMWTKMKGENKYINEPIDDFNHGIDALRYGFYMTYGKKLRQGSQTN